MEGDNEVGAHGPTPQHTSTTEADTVGSNTIISPTSEGNKRGRSDDNSAEWKMRSPVWEHYTFKKLNDSKEEYEATCKYCETTKYKVTSRYGTSNAKRHVDNCSAYKTFLQNNPGNVTVFEQRVFVRMFAEAIMYHSYPLSVVEHVKLREMLSYLNPRVRHVTRNTILRYCWQEHTRLKSLLYNILADVNSRVCFTCDCWSACTGRGFLTLTVHFVDCDWKLKSRILNFRYFPPPHRGVDIYLFVVGLIRDWGLEKKVFSLTCDNAGSMDVMVARLKADLLSFAPMPLVGRFFHVRCSAHILNLIVQSGLKVIDNNIMKIRHAVNYIGSSDARLCEFEKCVKESGLESNGKIRRDCPTRWNSTYLMLKKAIDFKDALIFFAIVDTTFDFNLSSDEWRTVEFVSRFLAPFHSITEMFSGSDYPTANLYFANVLAIEKLLVLGHNHQLECIKQMASAMLEKFEKYWGDYSTLLAIAVVLDPRFKMILVRNALSKLYVHAEVEYRVNEVYEALVDMYKFYDTRSNASTSTPSHDRQRQDANDFDVDSIYDVSNFISFVVH